MARFARKRRERCDERCQRCYYCDAPLAPDHEHDHWPIAYRHGGSAWAAACLNCHDLKDRLPGTKWQPASWADIVADCAKPATRLMVAKILGWYVDERERVYDLEVENARLRQRLGIQLEREIA